MTELFSSSLIEQSEKLRNAEVSSRELLEQYLGHIEKRNDSLNIIIRKHFEFARKRAAQLDAHLKTYGPIGPLHGIPFTIKDAFRIGKMKCSFGIPGFQFLPSFSPCKIVERLEAAGAIIVGQTNVPLSCFDWQTNSPIYGLTLNPLDRRVSVGGSSGGSAASVAAYFSPFEIGSDVAGSIRYPAHCCGVYGLRPTHNLVPFDDIGPSMHKKSFSNLAVAGPIARSIADLSFVLSIISANNGKSEKSSEDLKIAYTFEIAGIAADLDTQKKILDFIDQLVARGHSVTRVKPKIDFVRVQQLFGIILGYEYKKMIPFIFRFRPFIDLFNYFFNSRRFGGGVFKENFQEGLFSSSKKYHDALVEAESLRKNFETEFANFDFWMTPTSCTSAIPNLPTGMPIRVDAKILPYADAIGNFATATSLLHHPVLTAPLPSGIGIDFNGKRRQDWKLLTDCQRIENLFRQQNLSLNAIGAAGARRTYSTS